MAWEHIAGNSSGPMNGDGSRKLTIHSTEGGSIESAVAAYRANNSWPTLTVDCRRRRVARHLTDLVGARALRNTAGGADETNRDGSVHIQIEVVGRAADPSSFGDEDDLAWFGREVIGPLCRRNHIPITTSVRWIAYAPHPPSSYGRNNGVRLSPAEWDAYNGVLAHMHVPDNDHGDAGAFPIQAVLAAARGEEDPLSALTPDQQKELLANSRETLKLVKAIHAETAANPDDASECRLKDTTILVRDIHAHLVDVDPSTIEG